MARRLPRPLSMLAALRGPSGAPSPPGPLALNLARLLETTAVRRRLLSEHAPLPSQPANSSGQQ